MSLIYLEIISSPPSLFSDLMNNLYSSPMYFYTIISFCFMFRIIFLQIQQIFHRKVLTLHLGNHLVDILYYFIKYFIPSSIMHTKSSVYPTLSIWTFRDLKNSSTSKYIKEYKNGCVDHAKIEIEEKGFLEWDVNQI